jgi:membrane-associated protease RseP (regulator of RpoE activity)
MRKRIAIAVCLLCIAQPVFAGERGYLGVWFGALPGSESSVQGGVVVNRVFAGSAAEQAGLKPGQIITQIDNVLVRDPKTAVALVAENPAGERISLTVVDRTGGAIRESHIFATLSATPPGQFAAIMTAKRMPPRRPMPPASMAGHCVDPAKPRDCRANDAAVHPDKTAQQ